MRILLKAAGALAAVVLLSLSLTNMLSPGSRPQNYPVRETAAVGSLGFADSWLWFLSPDDVNRQLDLMVSTGVHNARILMPWAAIQPAPDAYDWGQADTIINAANARGIAVVGLLNSTPHSAVLPEDEMREILEQMAAGALGLRGGAPPIS